MMQEEKEFIGTIAPLIGKSRKINCQRTSAEPTGLLSLRMKVDLKLRFSSLCEAGKSPRFDRN